MAMVAFAVGALTLSPGATAADAALLSQLKSFGTPGSGAGQLQTPVGVAIQRSSGRVYVADSGNARVEVFDASGRFLAAWGWGVADGNAQSEVCKRNHNHSSCQAGIPGSGPGQLSRPTSIAVGPQGSPSANVVFVGDAGANVVQEFTDKGVFLKTIDGTSTPQNGYLSLVGVAVDQSGNLWTADGGTDNIDEFDPSGAFVQQWNDTYGTTLAIAVDSTHDAVYLIRGGQTTERWTLAGTDETVIDGTGNGIGSGVALAVDSNTGNLFVDHGGDVTIYDHTAAQIDSLSLVSTTSSQGLAFASLQGRVRTRQNQGDLYVTDATNDDLTIYAAPRTHAPPLITGTSLSRTSDTLQAAIVSFGRRTTCTLQYIDDADFQATGFANATTVPCTPATLGGSFTYQGVSATVSGLTPSAVYHFRVVATNSAGTNNGPDQTFQAAPGQWAPFSRCPVDDPAMLATDGVNTEGICVTSNSTNGSITIGNLTTPTGMTDLQVGVVATATGQYTAVSPPGGALVADPVQITVGTSIVTATIEQAGPLSNFSLVAGQSQGMEIVTLPVKIHLESDSLGLGPNCFIGSEQDPIVLNPENTDLLNSTFNFTEFDPNGNPDPSGSLETIIIGGAVEGDSMFAVPGAQGCGANDSLDAAINAFVGLPSPAGHNNLVLDNASSDVVLVANGTTGQQFSSEWHDGFGATTTTSSTTTTTMASPSGAFVE